MIAVAPKLLILMRRKSDSSICRGSEKIIYVVQIIIMLRYFWDSYTLSYSKEQRLVDIIDKAMQYL